MQIGESLSYGNVGEYITVKLADGRTVMAIAGNVINSSKVLVIGDYAWSETSPQQISRSIVEVFRSKDTPAIVIEEIGVSSHISLIMYNNTIYLGLYREEPILIEAFPDGWRVYRAYIKYYGNGEYEAWVYGITANPLPEFYYATFSDDNPSLNIDDILNNLPSVNVTILQGNQNYASKGEGMVYTDPRTYGHYGGETVTDVDTLHTSISYGSNPTISNGDPNDYYNYDYTYEKNINLRINGTGESEGAYLSQVENNVIRQTQVMTGNTVAKEGSTITYLLPVQNFSNGYITYEGWRNIDYNDRSNFPATCDPNNRGSVTITGSETYNRSNIRNSEVITHSARYLYLRNRKIEGESLKTVTEAFSDIYSTGQSIVGVYNCADWIHYYGFTSYRWETNDFTLTIEPRIRNVIIKDHETFHDSIDYPITETGTVEEFYTSFKKFDNTLSETMPGATCTTPQGAGAPYPGLGQASSTGEYQLTASSTYEELSGERQYVNDYYYMSDDFSLFQLYSKIGDYVKITYEAVSTSGEFPLINSYGQYATYYRGFPSQQLTNAYGDRYYIGAEGWGAGGRASYRTIRTEVNQYTYPSRKWYYMRGTQQVEIDRGSTDIYFNYYYYNNGSPVEPLYSQLENETFPIELELDNVTFSLGVLSYRSRWERVTEWIDTDKSIPTGRSRADSFFDDTATAVEISYTEEIAQAEVFGDNLVGTPIYAIGLFFIDGKKVYKRFEGVISSGDRVTQANGIGGENGFYENISIRLTSVEYFGLSLVAEPDGWYSSAAYRRLYIFPRDDCFGLFFNVSNYYDSQYCHGYERDGKYYLVCSPRFQITEPESEVEIFQVEGNRLLHLGSKPAPSFPVPEDWEGSSPSSLTGYYTPTQSKSGYPLEWEQEDREQDGVL